MWFLILVLGSAAAEYGWVEWREGRPEVFVTEAEAAIPSLHVARATYHNHINHTGWAYLELHTNPDSTDEKQAFAAGYLEGFLTWNLIWMHWQNTLKEYCYNKQQECELIDDFLDENQRYIAGMIKALPGDPYWYQVKMFFRQIEGLATGYNEATTDGDQMLNVRDILWLNLAEEIADISMAVAPSAVVPDKLYYGQRCSGLVKLLDDRSELFTAHVTWSEYQTMLRMQKKYVLNYKVAPGSEDRIPGYKMSMSSYPGLIQSLDDFYMTSAGLVIAETTLSNSNKTLFSLIAPTGSVPTAARAVVAGRTARTGGEWVQIFRKFNSGTYNNEWYVVDYKKFRPRRGSQGARLGAGLLWVLDQLPGTIHAEDMTSQLDRDSYFASYNIAMFPDMFERSGGPQRVAEHGDWFGYHTNPRALIFKDKQASIINLDAMLSVMRYNDFRHDPRARCACAPPYSAENAISARSDLNPPNGTYPFSALGHRLHGGTDAKVASVALRSRLQFLAAAGPTHNSALGILPFKWSQQSLAAPSGQPDLWEFPSAVHQWEWD